MTTTIEWTEETWNPVTGCTKVSEGCRNPILNAATARINDAKGGDPSEWPADLRVRGFPKGQAK